MSNRSWLVGEPIWVKIVRRHFRSSQEVIKEIENLNFFFFETFFASHYSILFVVSKYISLTGNKNDNFRL